jgi:hypothetical protein
VGSASIIARAGADSNKVVITILVIGLVPECVMRLVKALWPGWQNIFAHLTRILFMAIRRGRPSLPSEH